MELTAYMILQKKGLNADVCIIIINNYREMCRYEKMVYEQSKQKDKERHENEEKLYQLWLSGKKNVHLSDLPHLCDINTLEKLIQNIWSKNISHRCCNSTGIVIKCDDYMGEDYMTLFKYKLL